MRLDKSKIYLGRKPGKGEEFVDFPPAERVLFVWELTLELWAIKNHHYVESRLQRNIANLIKKY